LKCSPRTPSLDSPLNSVAVDQEMLDRLSLPAPTPANSPTSLTSKKCWGNSLFPAPAHSSPGFKMRPRQQSLETPVIRTGVRENAPRLSPAPPQPECADASAAPISESSPEVWDRLELYARQYYLITLSNKDPNQVVRSALPNIKVQQIPISFHLNFPGPSP
jgi:hypothetical protein